MQELEFTVIINPISRYVIDPNRNENDIGGHEYTKSLIYTTTTFGKEMYRELPSQEEITYRINAFYKSYHAALEQAVSEKLKFFNKVYLIDLHSFGAEIEADVVLGNCDGQTMNESMVRKIENLFVKSNFKTAINDPFRGGYITQHYGTANGACEAIQIELAYHSYIDKRTFGEEELPDINQNVMENCRQRLYQIFCEISPIRSYLKNRADRVSKQEEYHE